MMRSNVTPGFGIALAASAMLCAVPASASDVKLPASMRQVVLEPIASGFRWQVVNVPVPTPGDHQVLVQVRAIGLNNGELSRLKPSTDASRAGRVPASDAAGEVVAIGKQVKDVRIGDRVVSMYFKDWADGPYARSKLKGTHGWQADGVLADYIALDIQAVAPVPNGWTYEQAATLPLKNVHARVRFSYSTDGVRFTDIEQRRSRSTQAAGSVRRSVCFHPRRRERRRMSLLR